MRKLSKLKKINALCLVFVMILDLALQDTTKIVWAVNDEAASVDNIETQEEVQEELEILEEPNSDSSESWAEEQSTPVEESSTIIEETTLTEESSSIDETATEEHSVDETTTEEGTSTEEETTTEETTTEEETQTEEETTTEMETETETETEEESYPWENMTLKEFIEWLISGENDDLIKEIMMSDEDKAASLSERVQEIENALYGDDEELASLAKEAYTYLSKLMGMYVVDETDEKTDKIKITADTGTITESGTYYLAEDVKSNARLEITNGAVVIDLNGHTLTGNGKERVITILNGANLTIIDSSDEKTGGITGGNRSEGGGIYNQGGTLTINGGKIYGNKATDNGGGIYNKGTLIIDGEDVQIYGNTAPKGGGIYNYAGCTLTISSGTIGYKVTDEDIKYKNVTINGEEISYYAGLNDVNNENRKGNWAVGNAKLNGGGGVYNLGTLIMTGGQITGNTVYGEKPGGGGAVYCIGRSAKIIMSGGKMNYNQVIGTSTGDSISGGAIRYNDDNATEIGFEMTGGEICYNYAQRFGGAIRLDCNAVISGAARIAYNTADISGGGISVEKNRTLTIKSDDIGTPIFEYNICTDDTTEIDKVDHGMGGAIRNCNNLSINGGIFRNNYAKTSGGAILGSSDDNSAYGERVANIEIYSGEFYDNSAGTGGGALFLTSSYKNNAVLNIQGGSFTNNYAVTGGAIYGLATNGTFEMNIQGGCLETNKATYGGAVALEIDKDAKSGTATISGTAVITDNVATEKGGGVYINRKNNGDLNAYVTGGTIEKCTAKDGAGIYLAAGTFRMTGGLIHTSTASEDGGGVYIGDGMAVISGGTIDNCKADDGGGVYITNGTFNLTGSGKISNCMATKDSDNKKGRGGGLYLGGGRAIIGVDRKLNEGKVTKVSYIQDDKIETSDIKCEISDCKAENGGAVYVSGVDGEGNSIIDNTTYNEEESTDNKSIDPSKYNVYISAGTIKNNTANENGGGICVNNGHILMDGGDIKDNTATNGNGGGIYLSSKAREDARVRIRTGTLESNYAGGSGGAIAVEGDTNSDKTLKITIGVNEDHYLSDDGTTHLKLDSSSSDGVDCDHINDGDLNDDFCPILKNNSSATSGGAVYIIGNRDYSLLNIYCLEESGNTAANDNDGVYPNQSDFLMVVGGKVIITTDEKQETDDAYKGHVVIADSIHIESGVLDIYGHMSNPKISGMITVELNDPDKDSFTDHRIYKDKNIDGEKIYTVQYVENFPLHNADGSFRVDKDGNKIRTGKFREFEIVKGKDGRYSSTIIDALFAREGYEILGWNTEKEGLGNWYERGDIYDFDTNYAGEVDGILAIQKHAVEGSDISDLQINSVKKDGRELTTLVLYAIWKQESYTIVYDANAGGETYSGSMKNQICIVGTDNTLFKNQFKREGYDFIGWNTKSDGSGTSYVDMKTVRDLAEAGETITLYAQWKTHEHHLIYDVLEGDPPDPDEPDDKGDDGETKTSATIREKCSDNCGHLAYATITAYSRDYNREYNPATVSYKGDWQGGELQITYNMKADEWDEKDTIDEEWAANNNHVPLHTGTYTASITKTVEEKVTVTDDEGNKTETLKKIDNKAEITYYIYRIQWDEPDAPTVIATKKTGEKYPGSFKITNPTDKEESYTNVKESYDYKYAMSADKPITSYGDVQDWSDKMEFSNNEEHSNYYFATYQEEDRDHRRSEISESYVYYTDKNGVGITIIVDTGLTFAWNENTGEDTPVFTIDLVEGYHYREYNNADDIKITTTDNEEYKYKDGESGKKNVIHTVDVENGVEGLSSHSYKITGLESEQVKNGMITIYVTGAVKDPTLTAKSKNGQDFTEFNKEVTDISVDSAFTAQFTVKNIYFDEYNCPQLTFGQALPIATTIIWKDMETKKYYYYIINDNAKTSIGLNEFYEMGTKQDSNNKYNYKTIQKDDSYNPTNFQYQFIVDFSQVAIDNRLTAGEIALDLVLEPSDNSYAPSIPSDSSTATPVEHQLTIGLKEVAVFKLTSSDENDLTGTLTANYTKSNGVASIWNGRKMAIVLTALDNIPSDLYITAKFNDYTMTIYRNMNGQFIIPLNSVAFTKNWENGTIDIELHSSMMLQDANYTFNAQWYVSSSQAATAPLNGYVDIREYQDNGYTKINAETDITFNYEEQTPSIKIGEDIDTDKYIYYIGDTFKTNIRRLDIPQDAEVGVQIQKKQEDGTYIAINNNKSYIKRNSITDIYNNGNPIDYSFMYTLNGNIFTSGSYRLLVTVSKTVSGYTNNVQAEGTSNILQVPYYFIVLNKDGTYGSK